MNSVEFIESAPDAYITLDNNLQIEMVNKAAVNLLGLERDFLLGKSIYDILTIDENLNSRLKLLQQSGLPLYDNELVILTRYGKRHCAIKGFKIESSLGLIITDNTELNHVLKDMNKFNQFLKQVISNASVSLQVIDSDKNIVVWNTASEILTGYSQDEVLGNSQIWRKIFADPMTRIDILQKIDDVMKYGKSMASEELKITAKDHSVKTILFDCEQMVDERGESIGAISLGIDITMRKRLEEQFLQSQKMEAVGTLAGGVAHDFNNLLTVILGDADLIVDMMEPDNSIYDMVQDIASTARRAGELTRQLLLFSRSQSSVTRPLSLNKTITGLIKMLRRLIGETVHISTTLGDDIWQTTADEGHIEQVILNLSINARDAMKKGGEIVLSTENVIFSDADSTMHPKARAGKFVCFKVKDQGKGMTKDIMSHIFDPFYTTKERGSGTGLGLSVVYGVINDLSGWIMVDSEVDKGSEFAVYLPVSATTLTTNSQTKAIKRNLRTNYSGAGEKLLLIEDEPTLCRSLSRALTKSGYTVFTAVTSQEADDVFAEHNGKFDLVISDVVLPGESGVDLVNKFTKLEPNLNVLLMTGYLNQDSYITEIQEREYKLLQKPFSLSVFLKEVKESITVV